VERLAEASRAPTELAPVTRRDSSRGLATGAQQARAVSQSRDETACSPSCCYPPLPALRRSRASESAPANRRRRDELLLRPPIFRSFSDRTVATPAPATAPVSRIPLVVRRHARLEVQRRRRVSAKAKLTATAPVSRIPVTMRRPSPRRRPAMPTATSKVTSKVTASGDVDAHPGRRAKTPLLEGVRRRRR
jgi:hypothetical protein